MELRAAGLTDLVPERTSFVGRHADDHALSRLFADGRRLVSIVGPGGIGKTRLARRFATRRLEQSGETWFCDLTEARRLGDVLGAFGRLLDVVTDEAPSGPANGDFTSLCALRTWSAQIGSAIARRGELLVVVDNFDHVVASAPETIGRWLAMAPHASFLVTSREPLFVEGEARHELCPLEREEAIQLFLDRVRESRSARVFSDSDRPIISEIVIRLDAIPLAVELSASCSDIMSLTELRDRLAVRVGWLKTDRRDSHARQATLNAVIEWSWDLLSPELRRALSEAAIFRGGFELTYAEAVLTSANAPETVDAIRGLRARSLLRAFEAPGSGKLRFGMYESIREWALEKLDETGGRGAVEARHAARALALCRACAPEELEGEIENLIAAHGHCVTHDPLASVELLRALRAMLLNRGPLDNYLALVNASVASLDESPGLGPAALGLAQALLLRGEALRARYQYGESLIDLERALRLAESEGDVLLQSRIHYATGVAQSQLGREGEAREHGDRARECAEAVGALAEEGLARCLLGTVALLSRDYAPMAEHFERALDLQRKIGNRKDEATTLVLLAAGTHEHAGGASRAERIARSEELFTEALQVMQAIGDRRHQAGALSALGQIAFEQGDRARATALYEEAYTLAQQMGARRYQAMTSARMGILALDGMGLSEARARFEEAVRLVSGADDRRLSLYRAWLGATLSLLGPPEPADAELRLARERIERARDPSQAAALWLLEGFSSIRRARASNAEQRERALTSLRARLDRAKEADTPELCWSADDAQTAAAVLRALLTQPGLSPESASPSTPAARVAAESNALPALRLDHPSTSRPVIDKHARWFQLPGGPRVDIARRRAPCLILRALVARLVEGNAEGLSVDALFTAGWPGEKIGLLSAAPRVYNAISTLREMGLRDLLVRREDGYALVAPISVVDAAPGSASP